MTATSIRTTQNYGSPPLWIDEDGVHIADQPKVVYSDPHYWPYTAQRPSSGHTMAPPFVPPQPQTDPPPGEDNGRNAEIAPEPSGHGLPLSKCEAYNRVYDQRSRSS